MPDTLRAKAVALLAQREYSRATLAKKLSPLAGSAAELERLLDDLVGRRQLSDARYAEMRVTARGRRYGDLRLARELQQDGVSDELIADSLALGEDETRRCREVWQKKFGILPDNLADRARQQRFLQYRGFSPSAVRQVLQGLIEEGDDE
ncbi:MAG: recombination regulator RecX [Zoogloeaceae bacterium]|jgi:regulatory protein|nr:recombination regulator RecX [Zoogloeaceae bacterium]